MTATVLSRRWGSGACFLSGNLVQAMGLLLIGAVPRLLAAALGGLLWGMGMMMRGVPMHSLRQSMIPPHLLGRVTALSWMAIFGASAIGTAVMTRVAAHAGAGRTMLGIGACVAVLAVVTWFGPIREG